eukprot:764767-Hanusia_phi.AAC.4
MSVDEMMGRSCSCTQHHSSYLPHALVEWLRAHSLSSQICTSTELSRRMSGEVKIFVFHELSCARKEEEEEEEDGGEGKRDGGSRPREQLLEVPQLHEVRVKACIGDAVEDFYETGQVQM